MGQLNSHLFESVYKKLGINLDKLGCIMLDVEPLKGLNVSEDKLYYAKNKERFWVNGLVFNKVAHLTLLYGLLQSGSEIKDLVDQVLTEWYMPGVEIDHVGFFNSPYPDEPYYCIVGHVKVNDDLMEGHQRLEFLPHINTFAGYKPHITLAYVKKDEKIRDEVMEYFNKALKDQPLKVTGINYGK